MVRWRDIPGFLRSRRTDPAALRAAQLRREAMAWISLLSSGTATDADADALERWRRADPAHAQAYAKAAILWDMLTPVVAKVPDQRSVFTREPLPLIGRRAFLGGAAAASAAGAAYAVVYPPLYLWPSLSELRADVRTSAGEQRRIEVSAGFSIDLNTRSSMAFRPASDGSRHIELIAGEAVVTAEAHADGPCVVLAGNGRVLAREGKVDVRYDGREARIVCLAGRADVEHLAETLALTSGEQVTYDSRGLRGAADADVAAVAAWQQGRLIFRNEPLAQVIDEVNRYRPGRIILIDRTLGQRLIDASFNLDQLDNVMVFLQQAFDARITALPGGVVLIG